MEEEKIIEYVERWRQVPPEQILRYMKEMRDFLLSHMTEEGRRVFELLYRASRASR